jgi:hypothetical protein
MVWRDRTDMATQGFSSGATDHRYSQKCRSLFRLFPARADARGADTGAELAEAVFGGLLFDFDAAGKKR